MASAGSERRPFGFNSRFASDVRLSNVRIDALFPITLSGHVQVALVFAFDQSQYPLATENSDRGDERGRNESDHAPLALS